MSDSSATSDDHVVRATVFLFVAVAAGHALGTAVVYRLSHTPSIGVTFFPGDGVTVAALLLVRRRHRATVLAATYLSELVSHFVLGEAVVSAFGLALSNTVGPALSAYLVLRWVGGAPRLSRRPDLIAFLFGGVVCGPLLESLIGPMFARINAVHGSLIATMARWGTGDALGILIVGGFLVSWATEIDWPVKPRYAVFEANLLGAAVVVVSWLAFWRWNPSTAFLAVPLLGWAAVRFGTRGATTAGLVVTAIAEWATLDGHGEFAVSALHNREVGLWLLQLFLAVLVIGALFLASQVAELAGALSSAESSEEQYRRVFDATSDGILINDMASGRVVEVNPAFCNMHGYSREELVGADARVFIHPEDWVLFSDYLDAVRHGAEFRTRARDVTKGGRVFDVEVRGRELPFDGRPHVLAVVRDVSEEAAAYRLLEERVADRTRELSGLLSVAARLASTVDIAEVAAAVEQDAPRIITRSRFAVWRLDEGNLVPTSTALPPAAIALSDLPLAAPLLERGELVRCRGQEVDPELFIELARSGLMGQDTAGILLVPLVGAGELIGTLAVARLEAPRYTTEELDAARGLASHVAVALGNVALFERTQKVAAGEARQAVARDLHDSISQTLFSMTLHAKTAEAGLRQAGLSEDSPGAQALREVTELTRGALAEMRALIFELRPGALAEEGLVAALSKHAGALSAREGLQVDVVGPRDRLALDASVEEELYRLAQEALYNVVKHANTESATVSIAADNGSVVISVRDDGMGFDPSRARPGHVGLHSMRERAERLDGHLLVDSAPGAGTTVTVTVPSGSSNGKGA